MLSNQSTVLSREAVVDGIRQRILRGNLAPGQRLVESELCDLFGATRGTVRAAFTDLAHEGLVERIANKGARVRIVDLEEALNIVEVRMEVEGLCVARAAERITDSEISNLRDLAKKLEDYVAQGEVEAYAEMTRKFFQIYVGIANQPVAAEMLARLRSQNYRHGYRLTYRKGRARVALPFWLSIIDGICNRDPEAARNALRRHAENVRDSMMALAHEDTPFELTYSGDDAKQTR